MKRLSNLKYKWPRWPKVRWRFWEGKPVSLSLRPKFSPHPGPPVTPSQDHRCRTGLVPDGPVSSLSFTRHEPGEPGATRSEIALNVPAFADLGGTRGRPSGSLRVAVRRPRFLSHLHGRAFVRHLASESAGWIRTFATHWQRNLRRCV